MQKTPQNHLQAHLYTVNVDTQAQACLALTSPERLLSAIPETLASDLSSFYHSTARWLNAELCALKHETTLTDFHQKAELIEALRRAALLEHYGRSQAKNRSERIDNAGLLQELLSHLSNGLLGIIPLQKNSDTYLRSLMILGDDMILCEQESNCPPLNWRTFKTKINSLNLSCIRDLLLAPDDKRLGTLALPHPLLSDLLGTSSIDFRSLAYAFLESKGSKLYKH